MYIHTYCFIPEGIFKEYPEKEHDVIICRVVFVYNFCINSFRFFLQKRERENEDVQYYLTVSFTTTNKDESITLFVEMEQPPEPHPVCIRCFTTSRDVSRRDISMCRDICKGTQGCFECMLPILPKDILGESVQTPGDRLERFPRMGSTGDR